MRFSLIDRIIELEPGRKIVAVKALTMAEEYLADHFPRFPVMPGVLMLQAMTEASSWLVRVSEDFAHSMVVLSEAANVKYGQFVEPGQTLTVTAEIVGQDEQTVRLKASGKVEGELTVGARLVLRRHNLADADPDRADSDRVLVENLRRQFRVLWLEPARAPLDESAAEIPHQPSQI